MDGAERLTAVVLDRYPLWHEAVEHVLVPLGIDVVGKTTSPFEALELVEPGQVDLLVTGITMPDGEIDGLDCLRRARERAPGLRAIVLSMHEDQEYADDALAAGASAYVTKTAHPDELASAVRRAFGGLLPAVEPRRAAAADGRGADTSRLTRREREILRLMAQGHSNAQLAKMLWVTEQTVKFHLSNIYRKLDVANRTEASRWAQRHGLLDGRGPDDTAAALQATA